MDSSESGSRRRCLVTGRVESKETMLRFVIGPDGVVVPDIDERLPGRGFWLCASRDMLEKACDKGLFSKAARTRVQVPPDLIDRVERALVRRCLDYVGLARRAGQAVFGYEKSREWLNKRRAGIVLAASDGAIGSRAKVRALAPEGMVLELFSSAELGAAAGCERIVHAVLAPGRLASALRRESRRLAGVRRSDGLVAKSGDTVTWA